MVFKKFLDRIKESKEARIEATRLMKEKMDAETAAFKQKIEQQTADAIAQNQTNHDAEMNRMFKKTLDEARKEVNEKYTEICEIISNAGGEGDNKENDSRLEGLSDDVKAKIITDMKDFRRKASAGSLSIQLTYFKSFGNNHVQRISIYGEAPSDFIDDYKRKRDEIERLINEKQQELES